ncbi:MBF1-domain-containing protein [Cryphonectria parasitica EP155]|uniref:Multiprotein-bridging factor 1 n=1 Tax=Cryphonectria parasitica (strain ATCC 38755 / EP155) TaxID=660469 RepID=A0A9P4XUI0_CRYP1|nr:MBF1-domain-containing protein [Cryphonectria parasitica EP155]KAF3761052.1 MBF1-domain-containing protein [Cryphonectria parasitica EP155]
MSDWEPAVKIGSKARGGATQKETVVRGKGALNAAQRSGAIIGQEKKFAVGNAAKGNTEGQRQKKLDENPDIIKPKTVGIKVGKLIQEKRNELEPKMTRDQLAKKCNTTSNILGQYEAGTAQPDQKILDALERALNVKLRGAAIGEPKFKPKGDKK